MLYQWYFTGIFLFWLSIRLNGQYYLYDDDCLDFYATDTISSYFLKKQAYRKEHQIISFCRRDDFEDKYIVVDDSIPSFTFDQLNKRNITSLELYSWSTHLDLVEEYQAFLEYKNHSINNKFYNCSSKQKFGLFCQYSFNSNKKFDTIVTDILKAKNSIPTNGTCYLHLTCMRTNFSWCLDWREICDGKVDCWPDPVDEQHCNKLEQNECGPNEYRCRNGQCIPKNLLLDNSLDPDCLDRSDEDSRAILLYPQNCYQGDPSFRCADTTCNHWTDRGCPVMYCHGAGYCRNNHIDQFRRALLLRNSNYHLTDECWAAMICLIKPFPLISLNDVAYAHLFNGTCNNVCSEPHLSCIPIIRKHCPPLFEFPALPIGWSQLHFLYSWNQKNTSDTRPAYVCSDEQFCAISQSDIRFTKLSEPSKTLSCQLYDIYYTQRTWATQINDFTRKMDGLCSSMTNGTENNCLDTMQFRCGNKCLSKHRLVDYFQDCYDYTDEQYRNSCALNQKYRQTCIVNKNGENITQCILPTSIWYGFMVHCETWVKLPRFYTLCDGYEEYNEIINGQIETDETNCEKWQCDNQYTRCDGIWNCRNGADEAGCSHPVCTGERGHPCILPNTTELICLPVSSANDGRIDCLGATDERHLCRESNRVGNQYRCLTNRTENKQIANEQEICINYKSVCDKSTECPLHDDELSSLCQAGVNSELSCDIFWGGERRVTKYNIFCSLDETIKIILSENAAPHFSLTNFSIRPPLDIIRRSIPVTLNSKMMASTINQSEPTVITQEQNSLTMFQCHGGIPVYSKNNVKCLCPQTYYGSQCEYQNQRVSVTLRIGAAEWRSPFIFIAYIFDNTHYIIDSYHYIQYLSIRDCSTKFNFHLLYSFRPKFIDRIYSVRIDVFEMMTLKYRASWIFSILFSFLPVYRLSTQLLVPFGSVSSDIYCPLKCTLPYGRCTTFVNTGQLFCQCYPGWSGPMCTNPYECNCSPDSICIGTSKNRSICVCPTHKFGQRCYLSNNLCQQSNTKKCRNGGQCIPRDNRIIVDNLTICACPDGFYGNTCELNETRIDISISVPNLQESLLLHFITVRSHMAPNPVLSTDKWGPHERATTSKRIPFDRDLTTIYWTNLFHILFAEYDGNMYLLLIQLKNTLSYGYNVSIESNKRCPPIRELLNHTIVEFPPLRRVKYYHVPCQERIDLECFHDEDQFMCLCTFDRRANCFTFDHHLKYDCSELSHCENGGQCFQNTEKCPTAARCACPTCFLGTRCQLSTRGFGLSLDVILGYQVRPGFSFNNQPSSIKVSGILTIIILIIGLVNGALSILTFRRKLPREVGCGIYLLMASIISILTTMVFTVKYFLLVLTQLAVITDIVLLNGQCMLIDFLIKVFLQIGDWLYACVAIERLISAIKGPALKKKFTRKIAKWIILFVCIFVIGTSIQEPIYRTLITDEDEGRIWCIVRYSKSYSAFLNTYTIIMSVIHFIGPFVINIISSIGIITITTKYRSRAQHSLSYSAHFCNQLRQHKYLIISPLILIILALPRIVFAFTLDCMKSARDPVMFYLIGYFISFVPPVLLFIVFVLPSDVYTKEFKIAIKCKRTTLRP